MLKKVFKTILFIIVFLRILPYFVPREFERSIPKMPYVNSAFFNTQDGTRHHAQISEPVVEVIGKIVMLHGLGASSFSYRNNAPYLRNVVTWLWL